MSDIKFEMEKMQQYTARVDRTHPTAFVFLIDQSGSMSDVVDFNGESLSKAEAVAQAINTTLGEIINRCTKSDEIRHYFDVALIGYGFNSEASLIYPDTEWMSPEALKNCAKHKMVTKTINIRGTQRTVETTTPYWVEPIAHALTPMYQAFAKAYTLLEQWCDKHKGEDCFPPIVINITDGAQTDAEDEDMIEIANKVKSLATLDGNVLVFNIHLSDNDNEESLAFPSDISQMGNDTYSQMLYEMSSELPDVFNKDIALLTKRMSNSYRAMGLNTRADFVQILNIGTQTTMSADDE